MWGGCGTAMFVFMQSFAPAIERAEHFAVAIHSGDLAAATANADASLDQAKLEAMIERAKELGGVKRFQIIGFSNSDKNGVVTWQVRARVEFEQGTKSAVVDMSGASVKDAKVTNYLVLD
jgi:hypothetical protein